MSMENLSLSDIASVTRDNDGWGGGMGFFWIFALLLLPMLSGGGLWGNNADALSNADLQRAVDLNSIQQGQRDIEARVQEVGAENISTIKDVAYNNLGEIRDVGSAVSLNGANIINNLTQLASNMQNCCCETKQQIMESRYQTSQQIAQSDANTTAQIQKIMDKLNEDKIEALQNQINALNLQNAVAGVVRYPMASTYTSGSNPFCSCNCGSF